MKSMKASQDDYIHNIESIKYAHGHVLIKKNNLESTGNSVYSESIRTRRTLVQGLYKDCPSGFCVSEISEKCEQDAHAGVNVSLLRDLMCRWG